MAGDADRFNGCQALLCQPGISPSRADFDDPCPDGDVSRAGAAAIVKKDEKERLDSRFRLAQRGRIVWRAHDQHPRSVGMPIAVEIAKRFVSTAAPGAVVDIDVDERLASLERSTG